MPVLVKPGRCPQDHACPALSVCPVGALKQDGFKAPEVDQELCIDCGACTALCPYRALTENEKAFQKWITA
jgi:Fe-S-cluster-containing hydrogenase component 2